MYRLADKAREIDGDSHTSDDDAVEEKTKQDVNSSDDETAAIGNKGDQAGSSYMDYIQSLISEKLHLHGDGIPESSSPSKKILSTVDVDGVMKRWKSGGFKNIITMVGAGISTCMYFDIFLKSCQWQNLLTY